MNEIRTYPAGVTSWIDVEVADVEAAQQFYGALFGWQFVRATPPHIPFQYFIAQLDERDVAGLGGPIAEGKTAAWNTYVAVDDAAAAADTFVQAGGKLLEPPTPAGEGGISVIATDPEGVEIRLWQAKNRKGAQVTNVPGTWNFSDLHTDAGSAAIEFYTTVFDWAVDDMGFARLIRRPGYGDHLAATVDPGIHERQSGNQVPPGFADAIGWIGPVSAGSTARWQVAFTVADRDETVAKATELGATVLSTTDTDWTREALIRDTQGAEFTASQYTPPDE